MSAVGGGLGDLDLETATSADFPRWKDPTCPHPADKQQRDGMGTVCRLCGVLQVIAW